MSKRVYLYQGCMWYSHAEDGNLESWALAKKEMLYVKHKKQTEGQTRFYLFKKDSPLYHRAPSDVWQVCVCLLSVLVNKVAREQQCSNIHISSKWSRGGKNPMRFFCLIWWRQFDWCDWGSYWTSVNKMIHHGGIMRRYWREEQWDHQH